MEELPHTAASPMESRPGGPGEPSYREPLLLRYLRLLWEHRGLILGSALPPALLVAVALYLWPTRYTATFAYERPLSENEFNVLRQRFQSQENLDKIAGRLQEQGLTRCVQQVGRARARQAFDTLVRLEVSPIYPKRFQTTDPCTSENISSFKAKLLSVEVRADSQAEAAGLAAVVTDNIEGILPLYDIRNHLKESLAKLRRDTAKIEDDRFTLSVDLQKEKAKLEKLKGLEGVPAETAPSGVILQFNVDHGRDPVPFLYPARSLPPKTGGPVQNVPERVPEEYDYYEFLPLSYQIRAIESKIVDLQETLGSNAQKHDFYVQAMDLDNRLLAKIEESLLSYYTAQQYLGFVGEQLLACQDPALGDYLRAYTRKMENLVLVNTRVGATSAVYPVSKDVVRNSVLAFLVFGMAAVFVAVLREHRREYLAARPRPRTAVRGDSAAAPEGSPG
jgi:hypothetical protein